MPTPDQIVSSLQELTATWRTLAIVWHILFAGLVSLLVFGSRPSRRVVGVFLTLPLFSVAILAFATANPFNGILFTAGAVALAAVAMSWEKAPVTLGVPWIVLLAVVIFAFGWVYPHFNADAPPLAWLYASPVGVVPAPTVALVIGSALLVAGLESRTYSALLGILGLFYGIFGVARLGVVLDWGLVLASLVLLVVTFVRAPRALTHAHP